MRSGFLAALLAAAAHAPGAEPLFRDGEPTRFPLEVPLGPGKLAIADLNGDGREDLAVLALEVVVFIARGNDPVPDLLRSPYEIDSPAPFILAGDLDGDDRPELLVGGSAAIQLLRNAGDGTFTRAPSLPVDLNPRAAQLTDLDDDGFRDLVTVNQPASRVASLSIFIGDSKGGFLPEVRRSLGDDVLPHSLAAEDFGGDGLPDVAVSIVSAQSRVSVFPGRGGSDLGSPIDTLIDANPRILSTDYMDPDDEPDLVVLAEGPDLLKNQIFYLGNTGGEEFTPKLVGEDDQLAQQGFELLATEDFDEDGIIDIVTQFQRDGRYGLRVRYGTGTGDFPRSADRVLGGAALDFGLLDANGDGLRDLAVVEGTQLAVYAGLAPGRLDLPRTEPLDASPRGVLALDWSGDGKLDLVAHASSAFYLLTGDGSGEFEQVLRRQVSASFESMALGDFDGNGAREPVLANLAAGLALILFLEPRGEVASTKEIAVEGVPLGIAAEDLDGDMRSDVIVPDFASSSGRVVFDPAGEARALPLDAGAPQTAVDAGDVDGDGSMDVVLATKSGLRIFLGDGSGGFPRTKDMAHLAGARHVRIERTEGRTRGIAGVAEEGAALVWIADPLGAASPVGITDGAEFMTVRALDIDGDSIADLLSTALRPTSAFQVRIGAPGGGFGLPDTFAVGLTPMAFDVADLNGDGLIDAVTADHNSRALTVLEGAAGQRPATEAFRRGDADLDGNPLITDAIVVLAWLFQGGPTPACEDAADTDDSGTINLTDPVFLLDHLFRSGPEPPVPGLGACGEDPTADGLVSCDAGCT